MVKQEFSFNVSTLIGARNEILKKISKQFPIDKNYQNRWKKTTLISWILGWLAKVDRRRSAKLLATLEINEPPIFIIGHWRSGTTYLHNLMCLDKKAAFPTTYQSVFPNNLFAFQPVIKFLMNLFLPSKRPGDGLPLLVDQPQEDEFAIGNEIDYSFYYWLFFPKQAAYFRDLHFLSTQKRETHEQQWKENYIRFIKRSLLNTKGSVYVSKNPPNTARIPWLLDLFPDAKFIFLHRDPYDVYASTCKFFKIVIKSLQLQHYSDDEFKEHILESYRLLHEAYFQDVKKIPKENLIEIPYQQLVDNPLSIMQKISEQFGFPDMHQIQERLNVMTGVGKNHKPEAYGQELSLTNEIYNRWSVIFDHLGYPKRG